MNVILCAFLFGTCLIHAQTIFLKFICTKYMIKKSKSRFSLKFMEKKNAKQ